MMVAFEIEFPEELQKMNLGARYTRARKLHLVPAMDKSIGITISRVRSGVPVGVSGEARSSIGSALYERAASITGKITSSMRRPNVWVYVLNAGRKPGRKQPPSDKLIAWVQKRGLAANPTKARQAAYLIARAIKKKGTAGLSFMWRSLDDSKSTIESYHRAAVEQMVQELGKHA